MAVALDELEKALLALKQATDAFTKQSDQLLKGMLRDAVIQRFEFCVDLAWKSSIKTLGLDTSAPKPAIREMAQAGFINNPEQWFDFVVARNKSSHTYNERIALEVLDVVFTFVPACEALTKKLSQSQRNPTPSK